MTETLQLELTINLLLWVIGGYILSEVRFPKSEQVGMCLQSRQYLQQMASRLLPLRILGGILFFYSCLAVGDILREIFTI